MLSSYGWWFGRQNAGGLLAGRPEIPDGRHHSGLHQRLEHQVAQESGVDAVPHLGDVFLLNFIAERGEPLGDVALELAVDVQHHGRRLGPQVEGGQVDRPDPAPAVGVEPHRAALEVEHQGPPVVAPVQPPQDGKGIVRGGQFAVLVPEHFGRPHEPPVIAGVGKIYLAPAPEALVQPQGVHLPGVAPVAQRLDRQGIPGVDHRPALEEGDGRGVPSGIGHQELPAVVAVRRHPRQVGQHLVHGGKVVQQVLDPLVMVDPHQPFILEPFGEVIAHLADVQAGLVDTAVRELLAHGVIRQGAVFADPDEPGFHPAQRVEHRTAEAMLGDAAGIDNDKPRHRHILVQVVPHQQGIAPLQQEAGAGQGRGNGQNKKGPQRQQGCGLGSLHFTNPHNIIVMILFQHNDDMVWIFYYLSSPVSNKKTRRRVYRTRLAVSLRYTHSQIKNPPPTGRGYGGGQPARARGDARLFYQPQGHRHEHRAVEQTVDEDPGQGILGLMEHVGNYQQNRKHHQQQVRAEGQVEYHP